jgi:hypothetical protein
MPLEFVRVINLILVLSEFSNLFSDDIPLDDIVINNNSKNIFLKDI